MSEDVRPVSDERVRKILATFDHGESAGYAHQAALDLLVDRVWINEQLRQAREEISQLKSVIEGRWEPACYDPDGQIVNPEGWHLIEAGRYDELEASEADLRACEAREAALREALEAVKREYDSDENPGYGESSGGLSGETMTLVDAALHRERGSE